MNLGLINKAFNVILSAAVLMLMVSGSQTMALQLSSGLTTSHTVTTPIAGVQTDDSFQQPEPETEAPVFNELKSAFESGQIFSATFSHSHLDSFTGEETFMEGSIWIAEERYRVEGEEQVMIVDGETSRAYNGIENRVIINDYDEETDDFAPSRMLRGVNESYTISERTQGDETVVTLENDDPFALYYHVEVYIDDSGLPVRIVATDQVDNTDTTTFSSGRFIPDDNTLFQIDLPEDAERVDLRN